MVTHTPGALPVAASVQFTEDTVDMTLGDGLLWSNAYGAGNGLMVWEAVKVCGGQIHAVEAFMKIMPADAGSGWDAEVRRPVH